MQRQDRRWRRSSPVLAHPWPWWPCHPTQWLARSISPPPATTARAPKPTSCGTRSRSEISMPIWRSVPAGLGEPRERRQQRRHQRLQRLSAQPDPGVSGMYGARVHSGLPHERTARPGRPGQPEPDVRRHPVNLCPRRLALAVARPSDRRGASARSAMDDRHRALSVIDHGGERLPVERRFLRPADRQARRSGAARPRPLLCAHPPVGSGHSRVPDCRAAHHEPRGHRRQRQRIPLRGRHRVRHDRHGWHRATRRHHRRPPRARPQRFHCLRPR